ncbi:hypothetical protein EDM56_02905 [Brevibacillus fluminis]|uniref:Uncharacterized protein n=1 Tax=Brevibacillus fluminis TaxID=511487 RepID=A0A3M8DWP8_9BACL|nr:hypothetical protein [Brevibacillus fluminis]RNB91721.1 hypothetical protein EDM56_02905 [Brevibacillus fluminis]
MISIQFSVKDDLRRFATSTISPLYEMAASIHALTLSTPKEHHLAWLKETRDLLIREQLEEEWLYFAPVFSEVVPDILSLPYIERFVTMEELFEHLVHLSPLEFARSVLAALRQENRRNKELIYPVELDLKKDPDLVKSRLTLFVSSYWHIVFEPQWSDIVPRLSREVETINACLHSNRLGDYLSSISSQMEYDEVSRSILIADVEEVSASNPIRSIVLHPSWFASKPVEFSKQQNKIHIIYRISPLDADCE